MLKYAILSFYIASNGSAFAKKSNSMNAPTRWTTVAQNENNDKLLVNVVAILEARCFSIPGLPLLENKAIHLVSSLMMEWV